MKAIKYFEVEPFADGNVYNYSNYKEKGIYYVRGLDGFYLFTGDSIHWFNSYQIEPVEIKETAEKEPQKQMDDMSSIILKAIAVTQKPELILSVLPELFEAPIARKVID